MARQRLINGHAVESAITGSSFWECVSCRLVAPGLGLYYDVECVGLWSDPVEYEPFPSPDFINIITDIHNKIVEMDERLERIEDALSEKPDEEKMIVHQGYRGDANVDGLTDIQLKILKDALKDLPPRDKYGHRDVRF